MRREDCAAKERKAREGKEAGRYEGSVVPWYRGTGAARRDGIRGVPRVPRRRRIETLGEGHRDQRTRHVDQTILCGTPALRLIRSALSGSSRAQRVGAG